MHENGIEFNSHYISLPDGEQLEPWFARINPKMLVPSMKLDDGTVVNDSRVIMKLMDKNCPTNQEEKVERIMDIAYSCDLGWYSTVPLKKKVWLWRLMQESGLMCPSCPALMESHVQKTIAKYAKENPDLEEIYMAKLKKSTKDVNADYNLDRRGPIQDCLNDFVEILKERKEGEWVSGPVFTRADIITCIYVQWVKWQIGWDADLTLPLSLVEFYDEVKDRECIVKTFDVQGPIWVGYYWRERLVPVQRAIIATAVVVASGVTYAILKRT